jgi:DNA sulfur modification protein DndD
LAAEREDLRTELGAEIRRNFDAVKLKPDHWLELTPEFTLKLLKRTGFGDEADEIDVAHSTGERQLMSLVFMASLVALARRRAEKPMIVQGLNGREYPLVMDSPFGQLGEELRGGVAEWVPSLAPQVIVMVTSSQYKGEVEEKLTEGKRVGRRYLLTYHAPTKPPKAKKAVELDGERYAQYFQSDIEYTDIQEIER